ncbi:MAG: hypothetical protein MZU97_19035 [Bacillus subtilis]|nr:hypothetical protein [Bacillus subtilis]
MNYQYESNRIFASSVTGVLLAEVTFPNRDEKRVNVDHVFVDEIAARTGHRLRR